MDFLISSIISILMEISKKPLGGIRGSIRQFRIKVRLKRDITTEIMKRYENEVYYNDLDQFLTQNDVICTIIRSNLASTSFNYQSRSQTVDYYVQLFAETYPKYKQYHREFRNLIERYYKVIFNVLNTIDSEETRIVCSIMKELYGELSNKISEDNNRLEMKIDKLLCGHSDPSTHFFREQYLIYLSNVYSTQLADSYLERKIYSTQNQNLDTDILDVLLDKRKIILLGEAGFGKTYESISLLNKICKDDRTNNKIPIYLPLQEYGLLYADIFQGIKYKLTGFFEGNIDVSIANWLQDGSLILILDGIDDISKAEDRSKFIADFNNITLKYSKILYCTTTRFNCYHGELGEKTQYLLRVLSDDVIRKELRNEGVVVNIPQEYYKLFANPYFLSIGKELLKNNRNPDIFNRSRLFEELFRQLYGGLEEKRGISVPSPMTCSDALYALGNFAYMNFSKPCYSLLEFEEGLSKIILENKVNSIASFVSSGLFRISDTVQFSHKLLKEFCVAYYLINTYCINANRALFKNLVQREEWKEVFIFAGGLYKEVNKQDRFMDFVMENNLPLYLECVNGKSDLCNEVQSNPQEIANRLLLQIHKTYTYITSHYFGSISDLFHPIKKEGDYGKKVAIFGCLSNNNQLLYWLDFVSIDSDDINCISESKLNDYHDVKEQQALRERRNFITYGINLTLTGLPADSGRNIAINIIKTRLKELIDKRQLIESKYLMCERVGYYQCKIKPIREMIDLHQIKSVIDTLIDDQLQRNPNMCGFNYNGVEMFDFQALLQSLISQRAVFSDCILPEADSTHANAPSGWVWDQYSKEQKERRIIAFFYFHQLSYLEMVKANFPRLHNNFSRFQDIPYQSVVAIKHKEANTKCGFASDPTIQYHYIAAPNGDIPCPLIKEVDDGTDFEPHEQILQTIRKSYSMHGKKSNRYSTTQTGFSFTLTGRSAGPSGPLSDYVYKSIKESLVEIFGSL